MPLGVGRGQNVGLRDFCHSLTLLPPGASVFHKHMSSLNLEKRHQSSNVIKELKTQEGNVNNDYEIIGEMCKFYETLYTSKDINDENIDIYLENTTVNIIEGIDKEMCELFSYS